MSYPLMPYEEYQRRWKEHRQRYEAYKDLGGQLCYLDWFLTLGDRDLFDDWQRRRQQSSFVVSLRGLTAADGRRITHGFCY